MEFIVRIETRLLPQEGARAVDAFAEEMLQSLTAVDPDADMASGTREGVYNFWTVVEADAPELAALQGVGRVRGVAQGVGGDAATSNVWPSWARAHSVEAYPNSEDDADDLALIG